MAKWKYTLKNGNALRKAINDEDIEKNFKHFEGLLY